MMPEETILSRIEKEGMCPRPRWQFFLREGVIWTVGIASIGVGALAVAATLFEVRHAWWDAYEATHETFLTFLITKEWLSCRFFLFFCVDSGSFSFHIKKVY